MLLRAWQHGNTHLPTVTYSPLPHPPTHPPPTHPPTPQIGLVYMCMATVETKYVVAYMATSAFDTGGAMWLQFRSHVLSAVVILQILAIAVLGLKKAGGPAGLTLALLVCTIVYWIVAGPAAARPVATTALKTAQDIDALQGECKVSQPAVGMYVHPGMRLKGEDFDGVAEEAERMLAVMQERVEWWAWWRRWGDCAGKAV